MKIISAEELKKKIDSGGNFKLINVLSKESYDVRHIPKSISIPVSEIEDRAPKEIPDKGMEIIVHCASSTCTASPQAAEKLEKIGYTNVTEFKIGIAGWNDAGYEFEESD
jgi:rhodanese-related sulfurtransferase